MDRVGPHTRHTELQT